MGVPGFFAYILKNYKNNNIILKDLSFLNTTQLNSQNTSESKPSILYLDANCLIHPRCQHVLSQATKQELNNLDILESKMIEDVLNYITQILNIFNLTEHLFIAIDGVAPMAKINQQKKRRCRSEQDLNLRDQIKLKHKVPLTQTKWSSIAITPGTKFMEKLHISLINYIKKLKQLKNIKITYSSYHTPGEGEHKILQDIKLNKNNKIKIIYGLDADLIFLALASNQNNLYLMRESDQLNINNNNNNNRSFNYVSIYSLRTTINTQLNSQLNTNLDLTADFIFICYFLGNDFIPNLPSVSIRTDGLTFLINCYVEIYKKLNTQLILNSSINFVFLAEFLNKISQYENYYFNNILVKAQERHMSRNPPTSMNDYQKDLWLLDNMLLDIIDNNTIKNNYSSKEDYYKINFNTNNQNNINNICDTYIKSLIWIFKYYFDECAEWTFQYHYLYPPFVSDLANYLSNNLKVFTTSTISTTSITLSTSNLLVSPISPCIQLLLVVPPNCVNLLPDNYKYLMLDSNSPIIDLYPTKVVLDRTDKFMFHECVVLTPSIDLARVLKAVKNIELDDFSKILDKTLNNFVVS